MSGIKRRDFLVMGGILGPAVAGGWLISGGAATLARPSAAASASASATLPPDVARLLERLTPEAREAYAFALERPDVLKYIPCYCGCGEGGHTSNLTCFVQPTADGRIRLDSHGAG